MKNLVFIKYKQVKILIDSVRNIFSIFLDYSENVEKFKK